jgi:hypothetical protein
VSSAQMEEEPLNHQRTGLVIHDSLFTPHGADPGSGQLGPWPCRPVTSQGICILIFQGHVAYPTKSQPGLSR